MNAPAVLHGAATVLRRGDGLPRSLTTEADAVGGVWRTFLVLAVLVGALVFALVGVAVVRFRRRDDALPRQTHYRIGVEVAYTVVPLLLVVGLFAITLSSLPRIVAHADADEPPDLTVHVVGFRWQWRFEYPDSGVVVTGTPQELPVLVLPAGSTVRFELEATDVIHSFWLPGFRFKRDLIPGRPSSFDVTVKDEEGRFPGACAEFCGLSHADMRFTTEIVSRDAFDAWLDEHRPAEEAS